MIFIKIRYYNLQTDSGKQIAELETALQACKNELSGYKDLERELDRTIETYMPNIESEAEMRMFDQMTSMVPTNTTRRLKYSLYLARKVAELERGMQQVRQEVADRDTRIAQLTERLQKTQQSLEHTSQPYNFLVTTIEAKEKESELYKTHVTHLEREVVELRKEIERVTKRNKQLELDLEKLIGQKNVIDKLKSMLVEIRHENTKPNLVNNIKFQNLISKLNQ
jgi:DNA repair exonuclease SbcCD ATPase subunit